MITIISATKIMLTTTPTKIPRKGRMSSMTGAYASDKSKNRYRIYDMKYSVIVVQITIIKYTVFKIMSKLCWKSLQNIHMYIYLQFKYECMQLN